MKNEFFGFRHHPIRASHHSQCAINFFHVHNSTSDITGNETGS